MTCAVAADTKLETPEGPLTVKGVGGSPTAVMTRTDDGVIRFSMSSGVEKIGDAQPVLRLTLDNGRTLRLGAAQVLLGRDDAELRAGDLVVGDALQNAFAFKVGYEYRTDAGEMRISDGCVVVSRVEPAGDADLYRLTVKRTGRFVFSCGLIGRAAP
ncbi:MAG: hypothetical protein ABI629_24850 [bacterium]